MKNWNQCRQKVAKNFSPNTRHLSANAVELSGEEQLFALQYLSLDVVQLELQLVVLCLHVI